MCYEAGIAGVWSEVALRWPRGEPLKSTFGVVVLVLESYGSVSFSRDLHLTQGTMYGKRLLRTSSYTGVSFTCISLSSYV